MPVFSTTPKAFEPSPDRSRLKAGTYVCICKGFSREPVQTRNKQNPNAPLYFWVVTFEHCDENDLGASSSYWIQADPVTKEIANTDSGEGRWAKLLEVFGVKRDLENYDTEDLFLGACVCHVKGDGERSSFITSLEPCNPSQAKQAQKYCLAHYDDA